MLANLTHRSLTLPQLGLLHVLRLELWVNERLPADTATLARILRFPHAEIEAALPAVMPFFKKVGDDLVCPELDDYRAHLATIREKQRVGGKKGAEIRTANKGQHNKVDPSVDLHDTRGYSTGSGVESSRAELSRGEKSGDVKGECAQIENDDDWIDDYCDAEAYYDASRGS